VVWIAAPAAALERHHLKCKKKTSTQWLTVEECSRIGLSRGMDGNNLVKLAAAELTHSPWRREELAKKSRRCGTIIIQL
jgi:hypothetical protein